MTGPTIDVPVNITIPDGTNDKMKTIVIVAKIFSVFLYLAGFDLGRARRVIISAGSAFLTQKRFFIIVGKSCFFSTRPYIFKYLYKQYFI